MNRHHRIVVALVVFVMHPAVGQAQATDVYWGFWGDTVPASTINQASIDGTSISSDIVTGVLPSGMAINPIAGTMYLADANTGSIRVCNLAGTSCTTLITNAGFTGDVDIDLAGGRIYWADSDTWTIWSAPLVAPATRTKVWDSPIQPYGIALDLRNGYIYWSGPYSGSGGIVRGRIDGLGSIEQIMIGDGGGAGYPRGIAVDPVGGYVYFTESNNDTIYRLDLSMPISPLIPYEYHLILEGGSGGTPGLSAMASPWDMELDPATDRLYWTATTGVFSAGVDGSTPVELITGPFVDDELHTALALSFPIQPDGAPCTSPDLCLHRVCVDGVCCATECDGYCVSCNGADTGMASGACAPATAAPGTEPTCNDNSSCTDDFCTTSSTELCTHVAHVGSCDDGDPCTVGDTCEDTTCVPGPFECDAGPPDAGPEDAGPLPGRDAGMRDATVASDGASGGSLDAGPGSDAGGCACRAARGGRESPPPLGGLIVVASLGVSLLLRRRAR